MKITHDPTWLLTLQNSKVYHVDSSSSSFWMVAVDMEVRPYSFNMYKRCTNINARSTKLTKTNMFVDFRHVHIRLPRSLLVYLNVMSFLLLKNGEIKEKCLLLVWCLLKKRAAFKWSGNKVVILNLHPTNIKQRAAFKTAFTVLTLYFETSTWPDAKKCFTGIFFFPSVCVSLLWANIMFKSLWGLKALTIGRPYWSIVFMFMPVPSTSWSC